MNVLLINPPSYGSYRAGYLSGECLAVCLLAARLERENHAVNVVDARLEGITVSQLCVRIPRDVQLVGISVMGFDAMQITYEIADYISRHIPGAFICIGGFYPTVYYEFIFTGNPAIHAVIRGQGEETLCRLIHALENKNRLSSVSGIVYPTPHGLEVTAPAAEGHGFDNLPFPKRLYLSRHLERNQNIYIESSRGCYGECHFCVMDSFYRYPPPYKWNARSAGNIVEEIVSIREQWPQAKYFWFVDANFIGPPGYGDRRAAQVADLILDRCPNIIFRIECRSTDIQEGLFKQLRSAGLRHVFTGIESGSQAFLDRNNKKTTVADNLRAAEILNALDINYSYGFIMYDALTTFDEIKENCAFLESIGNVALKNYFFPLQILYNTPSYKLYKENGYLTGETDKEKFVYTILDPLTREWAAMGQLLDQNARALMEQFWTVYQDIQERRDRGVPGGKKDSAALDRLTFSFIRRVTAFVENPGQPKDRSRFTDGLAREYSTGLKTLTGTGRPHD